MEPRDFEKGGVPQRDPGMIAGASVARTYMAAAPCGANNNNFATKKRSGLPFDVEITLLNQDFWGCPCCGSKDRFAPGEDPYIGDSHSCASCGKWVTLTHIITGPSDDGEASLGDALDY